MLLTLLVTVLLLPSAVLAAPADNSAAPVPLPGGVADPAGKTGYLANDKGGFDAVNLENGELLWDSKDAPRPLVAFDQFLVCQLPLADKPNQVRIVVLDVSQKGKRLLESDPVVFPDWVSVGLRHGRSFTSEGRIHKGELLLKWDAHAFYAGGAAPTPEIVKRAKMDASGVARVSLETGKAEQLEADKVPAEVAPKLPRELEKVASQQYWTGRDWKTTPFVAGNTVSALALNDTGGETAKLTLKRWELATGKELEAVELLKGKSLWPQVSPDGRYVFVHQALVKEQLPEGDYAWWVFSLEDGKQVAKLPYEQGLTTVLGPRAYFLVTGPRKGPPMGINAAQPRQIKAVDLKTGKTEWERPIEPQRTLPPLP
jgi:hypothetical protein